MTSEIATRDSWKTLPLPEARAELGFSQSYSTEEFERIKRGLIPQEMEDKWFIFFEEPCLYFHRGWTGMCIYVIRFEVSETGASVVESWVNRDPEQYGKTDTEYDRAIVKFLIEALLLGKLVDFPIPGNVRAKTPRGLYQHHLVGRAYPETPHPTVAGGVNKVRRTPHEGAHKLLTVLGLAGIPALFLPFYFNTSPVDTFLDDSDSERWLLGLPFFLAPFAVAASWRWIVAGSLSRGWRIVGLGLGLAASMAVITASYLITSALSHLFDSGPPGPPNTLLGWIMLAIPVMTLLAGGFLLHRNSRDVRSREFNPVLSMQTAYVAHALFFLILFSGEWQSGAYFVLVTTIAFIVQPVLILRTQHSTRGNDPPEKPAQANPAS
jgi:hypothetical protein